MNRKYKTTLRQTYIFLALLVASVAMLTVVPIAQRSASAACGGDESILGIPTWHKYLEGTRDNCQIIADGEFPDNLQDTAGNLSSIGLAALEIAATLGALVALIMVFWGAFNFLTTQGEPDKAASARKTIQNAAIGLVILLISTRLVSFIGNSVS